MRSLVMAVVLACALAPAACDTYESDLQRAQNAFEGSEDERALAIFRILEPDVPRLSEADRAHYAYLRGMTDFRMGYKAEARHWLSIAAAMVEQTPEALPPDWTKRMKDSLKELNEDVYTGGVASLTNTPTSKAKGADDESGSGSEGASDTAQPAKEDSDKPKGKKPKSSDDDE